MDEARRKDWVGVAQKEAVSPPPAKEQEEKQQEEEVSPGDAWRLGLAGRS